MLASLPMYDWPEIREDTDRFWAALATELGVSVELWRGTDYTAPWRDPDLLFSQTCGYPFTHALRGQVELVATPHYAADGCEGPNYCSFVFARKQKPLATFRGQIAAINGPDSMSGMLALKLAFAGVTMPMPFFADTIVTGGHIASLQAVQKGEADVCAIDAVCVALAKRYRPSLLEGMHVVAQSPSVPGLPFITQQFEVLALQNALTKIFEDEALSETRERLLLKSFSILKTSDYDVILQRENSIV